MTPAILPNEPCGFNVSTYSFDRKRMYMLMLLIYLVYSFAAILAFIVEQNNFNESTQKSINGYKFTLQVCLYVIVPVWIIVFAINSYIEYISKTVIRLEYSREMYDNLIPFNNGNMMYIDKNVKKLTIMVYYNDANGAIVVDIESLNNGINGDTGGNGIAGNIASNSNASANINSIAYKFNSSSELIKYAYLLQAQAYYWYNQDISQPVPVYRRHVISQPCVLSLVANK